MNRLAILAGCALLASCGSKSDDAAAPAATESAAANTPAAVETPAPGKYDVVGPDGSKGVTTLNADGTYVDADDKGKELAKGTWAIKDGKTCFSPTGKLDECYLESARNPDGSFTATDAKGGVTQVKPQAK